MSTIQNVLPVLLFLVPLVVGEESESGKVRHIKPAVEILEAGDCSQVAKENDFITLHFTSRYEDGENISSTHDRGIPVEIQLGTKMLSTGLDEGLKGTCLNEKRRITIPAELGRIDILPDDVNQKMDQNTVYEIHVVSISDKTTVNTFNYLDLDGDKKISGEEAESLVKMFMKALTTDMGIDVKHLVSFFMALHDKDGDNFISETEFLNSVNAHEQVLDALTSRDEL